MSRWDWQTLFAAEPGTAPGSLGDARLKLHHAAQIVAAVGYNLLDPTPDDSHPNLRWIDGVCGLAGRLAGRKRPVQAALQLDPLHLMLLGADGGVLCDLDLEGRTIDEAYAWLDGSIRERPEPLRPPPYEIPEHAVARGATFSSFPAEPFEALARWYHNAHHALEAVAAREKGSEVRCWPHHFDIATVITLDSRGDPEEARGIGIGMSPGDDSYPVPYWYVNPFPTPETAALPALDGGGVWRTQDWTGAVLTAAPLVAAGDATAQRRRLERYLDSAIGACRKLLAR